MFQGFNSDLLSFYADIRFHNEKAFMDAHRKEYYQKVRDPFYAFIAEMAPVMLSIDPDMEVRPSACRASTAIRATAGINPPTAIITG